MKKENNLKGLLKKKIKDLTPEELKSLEQPLGTASRPFPMYGPLEVEEDGKRVLQQVMSVIASDERPLKVYSERPYHEVISLAYCDMPVLSMLPMLYDSLERRKPDSKNRTIFMKGDPGHGKSFMAALGGRMRSDEPVNLVDCGGKNINELLFEMVLDFGRSAALPDSINKLIETGKINPLSLSLLKQLPENMWSEDADGRLSVDWSAVKTGQAPGSSQAENVEKAYDLLMKVSEIEGLTNASGNTLGMNTQLGALPRAFIEGNELILDEYNKSKEGSDDKMQTVLQFLIGELDEVTVDNPLKSKNGDQGPSSFTFRREDMKLGFFVTFTGNNKEDGKTTRKLNKSVVSRLAPQILPEPDQQDWQHRMCQMMTGVPVSTLYRVFEKTADKDPEAFGEFLVYLRKTKAQSEGKKVPELEETLLRNWKNILDATEKLSGFYFAWREMTNIDRIAGKYPQLMAEIDEDYEDKYVVDFRRLIKDVQGAIPLRPEPKPLEILGEIDLKNFGQKPVLDETETENVTLRYGSRLVNLVTRKVFEESKNIGKHKLFEMLQQEMKKQGLRDIHLQEGARSTQKSVEELLNISAFNSGSLEAQAVLTQKIFCDFVRAQNPDLKDSSNENIVSISYVNKFLQNLVAQPLPKSEFLAPNTDLDTLEQTPFVRYVIMDSAKSLLEDIEKANAKTKAEIEECVRLFQDKQTEIDADKIVKHDELMAALVMPVLGKQILNSAKDSYFKTQIEISQGGTHDSEDVKVAEGTSVHNLSTTSLSVLSDKETAGADDARLISVHIIANDNTGKLMVVGEKISKSLQKTFNEAGIAYVDKTASNAKEQAEYALRDVVRGAQVASPNEALSRLSLAFNYRNAAEKLNDRSLAENLVDPETYVIHSRVLYRQ